MRRSAQVASFYAVALSIALTLLQPVAANFCLSLSSCSEAVYQADYFGCTCFNCTEQNGEIHAECTASNDTSSDRGTCNETLDSADSTSVYEAPPMNSRDYATICGVYIITSFLFAGIVKALAYNAARSKNATVTNGGKDAPKVMAMMDGKGKEELHDKAKGWFVNLLLKPFMPDEDSLEALMDVFADLNKWAGLILIPIARTCFFKTPKADKPRYPTKMQSFLKIIIELVVTLSLAFMLGTVVYNNEKCTSIHTVSACSVCDCHTYCNDNSFGCTDACECLEQSDICPGGNVRYSCHIASSKTISETKSDTKSLECLGADVSYSTTAQAITVILTEVFAIAAGIAVRSAKNGSHRQQLLYFTSLGLAGALAAFGWFYASSVANRLADGVDSDIDTARREAEKRRMKAIGSVLFAAWWSDQIVELFKTAFMSACGWMGFKMIGKQVLGTGKGGQTESSGAAIQPKLDQSLSGPVSSVQQPTTTTVVGEATASDVVIEEAIVQTE